MEDGDGKKPIAIFYLLFPILALAILSVAYGRWFLFTALAAGDAVGHRNFRDSWPGREFMAGRAE